MSSLCKSQFHCVHYQNGTSNRDHYTRDHVPCKKWDEMSCDMMSELIAVHTFTTGREPFACNLEKMGRIKKGLKGE
jgi:hypothetical protein